MKLGDTNLQVYEKNSFTYPPSRTHHDYFLLLKCASKISLWKYKQKVVLLVIYLINYDSTKSISFMLNVAFDFVLSTVYVK